MNIYELAKHLGYSPSVVARALSGKGYCSKEKKEIILNAAEELGYHSNIAAKTLRNNQTNTIVLCIPDIYNQFYFKLIASAGDYLENHGYHLMLCHSKGKLKTEIDTINMLQNRYCDGIIMVSFDFNDKNIKSIIDTDMPVVITNYYDKIAYDSNFDCVYTDHIEGMRQATDHLIEKGCKKILLFVGDMSLQTSVERAHGYIESMNSHGLPVNNNYIINGEYKMNSAASAMENILDSNLSFDAIITANDLMGAGVTHVLKNHGIKMGEDYKFVSFDNTEFARYSSPTITSVDMCQDKIGEESAKLLLDRILSGRNTSKTVRINPKFIERESSK